MVILSSARYGKDNIRLCRVDRDPQTGIHLVTELTICILLEGEIETSYTKADNSVVIATDTQKQTAYILAKQNPVTPIEVYAAILGDHFVTTYPHIHGAHVSIVQHSWKRLSIDGKEHTHSFSRDSEQIRTVEVHAQDSGRGIKIQSGIDKLLVLKSTGSAFHSFHCNEYTRLPETWDRILSTEIQCGYTWNIFDSLDEVRRFKIRFDETWTVVRNITLSIFSNDESASVQNTMFKMCTQILAQVNEVDHVNYSLPNKHYFEIDLSWHKDVKNTGKDAEVYAPQTDPNGLIECTVSRKDARPQNNVAGKASRKSELSGSGIEVDNEQTMNRT